VLRLLLWRLLGVLAVMAGMLIVAWFAGGGPGALLRGGHPRSPLGLSRAGEDLLGALEALSSWPASGLAAAIGAPALAAAVVRWRARGRRRYVRLVVAPYRTDHASAEALVTMFEALHKRLASIRHQCERLVVFA
jgi:hypothetical protein